MRPQPRSRRRLAREELAHRVDLISSAQELEKQRNPRRRVSRRIGTTTTSSRTRQRHNPTIDL